MRSLRELLSRRVAVLLLLAACTPQSSGTGGSGGATTGTGGKSGTPGTGGLSGSGGGAAPPASGGAPGSGGVVSTGGADVGGSGGVTGGGSGAGGVSVDAGEPRDGGTDAGGGATGTGGTTGTGGAGAPGGAGGAAGTSGTSTGGRGGGAGGAAGTSGTSTGGRGGGAGGSGNARFVCPAGPFPNPSVMSMQNVCQNFAFGYSWNEGPTWVAAQNAFFFSNFVAGSASGGDIIKYTPGGTCETFIRDVGCNGLAVSNDGNLLAACQQPRAIVRFDLKTKQSTIVVDRLANAMLDTPNDLIQHSNGSIYFTNPTNELAGRPQGVGPSVLRIDPMGKLSKISDGNFNGIALSPDEKTLYIVRTEIWDLDAQGAPTTRRTMFRNSGDGMAVDCAGNVYVEGKIFQPDGTQIGTWGAGTNLAFGGADGKTVLVAGSGKQVRELKMNVPGLP